MPLPKVSQLLLVLVSEHDHKKRVQIRKKILSQKGLSSQLIKNLKSENSSIRWECVNTIGEIKAQDAAKHLVNTTVKDDDVHVRWRAIWALSTLNRDLIKPFLLKFIRGKNKLHRWNAATAMAVLKFEEAAKIIPSGLNSKDEWVRWEALHTIRLVKTKNMEGKIASFFKNANQRSLRQEAALALGYIGTKRAITHLIKVFSDNEPEVRMRVSMGLARTHSSDALKALERQLKKEKVQTVIKQLKSDLKYLKREVV